MDSEPSKGDLMSDRREAIGAVGLSNRGDQNANVVKTLEMSPEADEFLSDLAQRSGLNEGNVLRLALGMFKVAIDAKQSGKHLGVAENSDVLETEIIGF